MWRAALLGGSKSACAEKREIDVVFIFFFFQAEDGIRDRDVTGVQTCALPISMRGSRAISSFRQALSRSTIVVGSPPNCGSSSVSNCSDVGSTSGEYTYNSAVSGSG